MLSKVQNKSRNPNSKHEFLLKEKNIYSATFGLCGNLATLAGSFHTCDYIIILNNDAFEWQREIKHCKQCAFVWETYRAHMRLFYCNLLLGSFNEAFMNDKYGGRLGVMTCNYFLKILKLDANISESVSLKS